MASSSSSHPFSGMQSASTLEMPCASPKLYDVFINHRGPDVKETLATQIYESLQNMGCRGFLDSQEMELGDSFPSTIENAIRSATVQIAIFSKRYAESAWCLAELCLMLKTKVKLVPIFYDVTPSDLRYIQTGLYAAAFAKYTEKARYLNKIEEWKEALHSVSFICGYELRKYNQNHEKLCKDIVSVVLKEVEKTRSLYVAKNPVGLNQLVEDFERRCQVQREQKNIIGIFGMGGSGKTTLTKALFDRKRLQYDGSCILFDVREASLKNELPDLQVKLLKDLVKEKHPKFHSTDEGRSYLRHRLARGSFLSFLIVVDDIDHVSQLDSLLDIDTLNSGSLVLITTRDERVLIRAGITLRYKIPKMDLQHSRELFCLHAFHLPCPVNGYEDLVESFVKECGGLPLSLQVLGGHVYGTADKHYWELELDKVRKMLPGDIKCRLKISFDALDSEQKQIFMDIACFFVGKEKNMAIQIWEGSGWSAEHALQILKDKCLIEVEMNKYDQVDHFILRMHDNLRDLGREMADELGTPRRMWRPQHLNSLALKGFENILIQAKGRSVRCFNSIFDKDIGAQITYFIGNSNESAHAPTVLLLLHLMMYRGQLKSIPSWIPLQNLQCLGIAQKPYNEHIWQQILQCLRILTGHPKRLWNSYSQAPVHLKELQLQGMQLREILDSLGMLRCLEELELTECNGTIEWKNLSDPLKKLTNLRKLVLRRLKLSGDFAFVYSGLASPMPRLETIHIDEVPLLTRVSVSGERCPRLQSLHVENMLNLIEMDLTGVTTLNSLMLGFCNKLKRIAGISELKKLASLDIVECEEFEEMPSLATLSCLKSINIDGCEKLQNITGMEELKGLKHLYLAACDRAARDCIHMLQRLPSEFTTVIGRAGDGAESSVNANLFSDVIGVDAVSELHINENGDMEVSLQAPQSLSAIIVCAVVESPRRNILHITHSSNSEGEWIVTIVLSTGGEINNAEHYLHYIDGFLDDDAQIKRGCIATVKKGEEWKTLHILKNILAQLF